MTSSFHWNRERRAVASGQSESQLIHTTGQRDDQELRSNSMGLALAKPLRSDRRVWFWTSTVVFVILGFIDPDGRGMGKTDLPSYFQLVSTIAQPSHWFREFQPSDPSWLRMAASAIVFIGIYTGALGFVSACAGWLLHFMVTPLLRHSARPDSPALLTQSGNGAVVTAQPAVQLLLAAYGGGAAVFGAALTGLNGLQFWGVWFIYDQINHAQTGAHSWSTFHSLVLLVVICFLNTIFSTVLACRISSPHLKVRLPALLALGFQLATLAISARTFGLEAF